MRLFFVTSPKCGSQWICDLITSPELLDPLHLIHRPHADYFPDPVFPELCHAAVPDGSAIGPIYNYRWRDVRARMQSNDRLLHVMRDPRDMLISLMYSLLHSHPSGESAAQAYICDALRAADDENRLTILFDQISFSVAPMLSYKAAQPDAAIMSTSYETILRDTSAFLEKFCRFVGASLSPAMQLEIATRHSFLARSGREPGHENTFSHYRKAQPGNWRDFFTQSLGRKWEFAMPGALRTLSLETDDDWWRSLPESTAGLGTLPATTSDRRSCDELEVQLARERERRLVLEQVASERHALIERLDATAKDLAQQCLAKEQVIEQLLAQLSRDAAPPYGDGNVVENPCAG